MNEELKYLSFIKQAINELPFRLKSFLEYREDIDNDILLSYLYKIGFVENQEGNPTSINYLFQLIRTSNDAIGNL